MPLRYCPDCKTEHLNAPCGLTYVQRLRSAQIHGSVTPTKDKQNYYEDEALKDVFGADRNERRQDMADATNGRGYTTVSDLDEL